MNEEKFHALKVALWGSDPWKMTSRFEFTCLHCGSKYNGGVPHETHKQDCIWLVNFQEIENDIIICTANLPYVPTCVVCGEAIDESGRIVVADQNNKLIVTAAYCAKHCKQLREIENEQ